MPTTVAVTLEQAAAIAELDEHEILWACAEHGECSTDAYLILPCNDGDLYVVRPRSAEPHRCSRARVKAPAETLFRARQCRARPVRGLHGARP